MIGAGLSFRRLDIEIFPGEQRRAPRPYLDQANAGDVIAADDRGRVRRRHLSGIDGDLVGSGATAGARPGGGGVYRQVALAVVHGRDVEMIGQPGRGRTPVETPGDALRGGGLSGPAVLLLPPGRTAYRS